MGTLIRPLIPRLPSDVTGSADSCFASRNHNFAAKLGAYGSDAFGWSTSSTSELRWPVPELPRPTLCSSRGEYTAAVAVARERCRSTCSRRVCACIRPISTLLAAEFPMGGAAVITPMGPVLILWACRRLGGRGLIYLRRGDSQTRVKAPYRGTLSAGPVENARTTVLCQ